MYRAGIVTLSDKGAAGEREDKSGAVIKEILESAGYEVVSRSLLPDEGEALKTELIRLSDQVQCDQFEKNEFWWGGIVHRGVEMPINANQHAVIITKTHTEHLINPESLKRQPEHRLIPQRMKTAAKERFFFIRIPFNIFSASFYIGQHSVNQVFILVSVYLSIQIGLWPASALSFVKRHLTAVGLVKPAVKVCYGGYIAG